MFTLGSSLEFPFVIVFILSFYSFLPSLFCSSFPSGHNRSCKFCRWIEDFSPLLLCLFPSYLLLFFPSSLVEVNMVVVIEVVVSLIDECYISLLSSSYLTP